MNENQTQAQLAKLLNSLAQTPQETPGTKTQRKYGAVLQCLDMVVPCLRETETDLALQTNAVEQLNKQLAQLSQENTTLRTENQNLKAEMLKKEVTKATTEGTKS